MRHPTRRAVLASTAGLPALSGLSRLASAQAPRRGGTLRVSVDQAASVIHPLRTRVNPEHMIAELCYSNLTTLTTDMKPLPDLAESWSSNADFTEWTFKLRKGARFSDGSACTAKDVVATYGAILDPKTASPARSVVSVIKAGPSKLVVRVREVAHAKRGTDRVIIQFANGKRTSVTYRVR